MKKNLSQLTFRLAISTIILFSYFTGYSQSWNLVGSIGFSVGAAAYTSIALDHTGTPYVVYQDSVNGMKATAMIYNDTIGDWVNLGSVGFSAGHAYYTAIAIDKNNTPYVVYMDGSLSDAVVVKKYVGTGWVDVGTPGFSGGEGEYTTIAIDSGGTPYVAYKDWGNEKKATVMKYNGTAWVAVGSPGFSDSEVNYLSLALDRSGTPYVVYEDMGNEGRATVMKYNGSNWVSVGNPGISDSSAWFTTIAIDSIGNPYIAYMDVGYFYEGTVMKYNGSSWGLVGTQGFSFGAGFCDLALDNNGTPYIVYQGEIDYEANVQGYNPGSDWGTIGYWGALPGISAGVAYYTSIAINATGIYIAYEDGGNGDRATVMEYLWPTGIKNIDNTASLTVFPNPNQGSFDIKVSGVRKQEYTVIITDILGQAIKRFTAATDIGTTVQLNVPSGVYFLTVVTIEGKTTKRIVID